MSPVETTVAHGATVAVLALHRPDRIGPDEPRRGAAATELTESSDSSAMPPVTVIVRRVEDVNRMYRGRGREEALHYPTGKPPAQRRRARAASPIMVRLS